MSYRARAYPYPVLSPFSDDFGRDASFTASTSVELDQSDTQTVRLKVNLEHTSRWLDEYILDGQARFVIDVECRSTQVRDYIPVESHSAVLVFDPGALFGRVRVTPLIVANVENLTYSPAGINEEFKGATFHIRAHDILAVGDTDTFELDFLRKRDRNLVTIQYSAEADAQSVYRFEFSGDRILIVAGEDLREPIGQMLASPDIKPYLYISVFKDCLAAALESLNDGAEDQEGERAWTRTLRAKLEELGRQLQPGDRAYQEITAQLLVKDRGFKRLGASSD